MAKLKKHYYTSRIPVLTHKGTEFQPDFLLAIKDGKTKLACLSESVNLSQLIYEVDCYLDILKDLRWAENKKKETKK